ncbi:MAG: hypothetical protein M3483_05995 [Gemmatimonadota bacterium]|nr:hypothetical protein [Gemmatimonadota bacterium]
MLTRILKAVAYTQKPRATFAILHPVTAAQLVKLPFDLRTAYAPRVTAVLAALVVAPLAYRLGRRSSAGTLFTPKERQ